MSYMRALVQTPFDTGALPLVEKLRTPYSMEHASADFFAPSNLNRLSWLAQDQGGQFRGRDKWLVVASGVMATLDEYGMSDDSDEPATLEIGSRYVLDLEAIATDLSIDLLGSGGAHLFAEACRVVREITRSRIQSFVGHLGRDQVHYLRDGTIRIIKREQSKPQWAWEIESLGKSRPTTRQLAKIIRTLKSLSNEGDYGEIDTAFRTIDVSSVSFEALIALLRTTYHCRTSLETWRAFLNSARKEAQARNLNAEEALFGLA